VRRAASLIARCGLATIAVVVAGWMLQWPSSGADASPRVIVVNCTATAFSGTRATRCPPADQRGFSRPYGPAGDIGAAQARHR
jgi:hypothetical protein